MSTTQSETTALTLRSEKSGSVVVNLGGCSNEKNDGLTILLRVHEKCPGSFALTPASLTTAATVYGTTLSLIRFFLFVNLMDQIHNRP